jgi:hypothetical protein
MAAERSREVTASVLWGRVANVSLALASAVAVALVVLAVEGIARIAAPDYLVRTRGLHVSSRTYGWRGRPGASAAMGDGRVTLNRLGYRGRELPLGAAPGRSRVVVLGDSIAFGYGVADEETFAHLLDARDNGIDAANLSVEGYGPGQELIVLRNDGLRARPDVVVLATCLRNDFADAMLPVALYNGLTPRPRFRLEGDALVLDDAALRRGRLSRAVAWLADYSHVYNRAARLLAPPPAPARADWRARKQDALRDGDAALRLTVALVLEMNRLCRERGIAFVVVTFPNGLSYDADPGLQRRFRDDVAAEGVRVVDLREQFRSRGLAPSEAAIDATGHLSPQGHAVAAEVLEAAILGPTRS